MSDSLLRSTGDRASEVACVFDDAARSGHLATRSSIRVNLFSSRRVACLYRGKAEVVNTSDRLPSRCANRPIAANSRAMARSRKCACPGSPHGSRQRDNSDIHSPFDRVCRNLGKSAQLCYGPPKHEERKRYELAYRHLLPKDLPLARREALVLHHAKLLECCGRIGDVSVCCACGLTEPEPPHEISGCLLGNHQS